MIVDNFTVTGLVAALAVAVILGVACKLRGCNRRP